MKTVLAILSGVVVISILALYQVGFGIMLMYGLLAALLSWAIQELHESSLRQAEKVKWDRIVMEANGAVSIMLGSQPDQDVFVDAITSTPENSYVAQVARSRALTYCTAFALRREASQDPHGLHSQIARALGAIIMSGELSDAQKQAARLSAPDLEVLNGSF